MNKPNQEVIDDQRQSLKEIENRAIELDHVVISNERLKHLKIIEAKYRLEKESK